MNKKNIIIVAVGVVVVVLLAVFWVLNTPGNKTTTGGQSQTTSTPGATTTGINTNGTAQDNYGAASESYVDALKKYTDSGYRIQFIGCSAAPGKLIVKNGKSFMLDNRGDKSIKVTVGTANYNIGAYKYAIISEYTLGTNYILCNGVRASEITIVK